MLAVFGQVGSQAQMPVLYRTNHEPWRPGAGSALWLVKSDHVTWILVSHWSNLLWRQALRSPAPAPATEAQGAFTREHWHCCTAGWARGMWELGYNVSTHLGAFLSVYDCIVGHWHKKLDIIISWKTHFLRYKCIDLIVISLMSPTSCVMSSLKTNKNQCYLTNNQICIFRALEVGGCWSQMPVDNENAKLGASSRWTGLAILWYSFYLVWWE